MALAVLAVGAGLVWANSLGRQQNLEPLHVTLRPDRLRADGYDTATLSLENGALENGDAKPPAISLWESIHGAQIEEITRVDGRWQARIRAGVIPGRVGLRIESGNRSANAELVTLAVDKDSAGDGTPDFLRLEDDRDQRAFRRWFAYLAEVQYFRPPMTRPAEINDCAALIRYAYREALHAHDSAWANTAQLPVIPALDSVAKYQYPFTPLEAALFRTRPGPYRPADVSSSAFLQFADAQTLWRYNTHFVSRSLARALPGDLLFYKQESDHVTFHSMIYLGESPLQPDGQRYVLYHTGPTGKDPGEIRRLTVEELMRFPQPEWRPMAANTSFLGVARWNILRRESHE